MKKNKKRNGFTLIELLVVVSILAVMSSIVLVAVSKARRSARNLNRSATIKQMVTDWTQAVNTPGAAFPDVGGMLICVSKTCTGSLGWYSLAYNPNADVENFISTYKINKPIDPPAINRPYTGYMYSSLPMNYLDVSTNQFLPGAHVFIYMLEPPYEKGMCGVGFPIDIQPNYIECVVFLKQ